MPSHAILEKKFSAPYDTNIQSDSKNKKKRKFEAVFVRKVGSVLQQCQTKPDALQYTQ